MPKIIEHNEGLGSYRYVAEDANPDEFAKELLETGKLHRTRSFVAWLVETPAGPDQYGRPQPGRTVLTEIARGLA
jgi:hypothetical protein